jgi:proteic killer suppression protein
MIRSFRHKGLKQFAETGNPSKLSVLNPDRVARILTRLDAARAPNEMDLAGLRFHALVGADKGRYSVRVTGNYRITFAWDGTDAVQVDLEDYH